MSSWLSGASQVTDARSPGHALGTATRSRRGPPGRGSRGACGRSRGRARRPAGSGRLVGEAFVTLLASAVRAAVRRTAGFVAVADDRAVAVVAPWCERV